MNNNDAIDIKRVKIERGLSNMIAARYDGMISRYMDLFDQTIQRTTSVLRQQDTILDIGCGTGIISLGLAGKVTHVDAIDIAPRMIEVAKEKAARLSIENVNFQIADGYKLPYDDATFDVVVVANVLHIAKDPMAMLAEARRVLKLNGYLVTLTDCYLEQTASVALKIQIMLYGLFNFFGMTYLNKFRKSDISQLLREMRFTIEDASLVSDKIASYYILGKKLP
jgi:ubiquinone/menaquinone biosynthesis C-methylase UbiE